MLIIHNVYLNNNSFYIVVQKRKGFYFRESKDGSLLLNINRQDFVSFISDLEAQEGWVKFRIYRRSQVDEKGHTHNMECVKSIEFNKNPTSE